MRNRGFTKVELLAIILLIAMMFGILLVPQCAKAGHKVTFSPQLATYKTIPAFVIILKNDPKLCVKIILYKDNWENADLDAVTKNGERIMETFKEAGIENYRLIFAIANGNSPFTKTYPEVVGNGAYLLLTYKQWK